MHVIPLLRGRILAVESTDLVHEIVNQSVAFIHLVVLVLCNLAFCLTLRLLIREVVEILISRIGLLIHIRFVHDFLSLLQL